MKNKRDGGEGKERQQADKKGCITVARDPPTMLRITSALARHSKRHSGEHAVSECQELNEYLLNK